jgi:diacylglycerol kinase family enzyme
MRALLVVNPKATTTSRRTREVLAAALDRDLKLEVAHTERRGHAAELARLARVDGLDLVVVLGGDGTVNETVNGLLEEGTRGAAPDLAVVPGGGANVFARALGVPRDPVEATGALLDALRADRRRSVGLSRADGRWFTFCAGLGLDAQVVAAVDRRRRHRGALSAPGHFVLTAVHQFFTATDRRHPALTVERPGAEPDTGLYLAIVANTSPWTYLGARPVQPTPDASFDTGLDLYALRNLRTVATLRQVRQLLSEPRPGGPRGRQVLGLHDLPEFTVHADRPAAFQVDGEPLGERARVTFQAVPRALRVVC